MAFASVATLGVVNAHSSAASIVLTTSAIAEVGNLVVVTLAFDNLGSGTDNLDASEVTSVTDSAGNTWVKGGETSNNNGAAAAGVTTSVWYSVLTNQIASGGTITANLSGSSTARTAQAWEFTKDAGTTIALAALVVDVGDAVDPASISIGPILSREYLLYYGFGGEQNNAGTYTAATNYTALGKTGTAAGSTNDIMVTGDYRIATLTGDTHDAATSTDRDYAAVYFALYEVTPAGGDDIPARFQMNTPGVMIFSPGMATIEI